MGKKLTTKEAAAELGVTVGRVRQLVLSGTLPAGKFGRDLVIDARDLKQVTIYGKAGRPKGSKNKTETQAA